MKPEPSHIPLPNSRRINPACPECMRLWGEMSRGKDIEFFKRLYRHLGAKLHPIK